MKTLFMQIIWWLHQQFLLGERVIILMIREESRDMMIVHLFRAGNKISQVVNADPAGRMS